MQTLCIAGKLIYATSTKDTFLEVKVTIGGSKGGTPGTRAPPGGPNSFIFMQFSAKMWKIIAILGVGAPPGENPGSATGYLEFARQTVAYLAPVPSRDLSTLTCKPMGASFLNK